MELFKFLDFEGVDGGLRTRIVGSKQTADQQTPSDQQLDQLSHCILTHEFDNEHWDLDDTRRHLRLFNQGSIEYFPCFYAQPAFKHKMVNFDWNLHTNQYKPDPKFIQYFNQVVAIHLKQMSLHLNSGICSQVDTLAVSRCLFNFSWLDPLPKRSLFLYLAQFLRNQEGLKNIILENAHLRHEDGLRMLLTTGLAVGSSTEKLYLWHFFVAGVMPLDIGYRETMTDPFILTRDLKKDIPVQELQRIWYQYIMDETYDLPHQYFYFFTVFLKTFTNLTTLYVNYSWVALGQGVTLNLLSSIRNGRLKDLYLLCMREDLPSNSGCRVSARAWLKAKQKCPDLSVHLVLKGIGHDYEKNVSLLEEEMPLVSYHLSAGLPIVNYCKVREPCFDSLIRNLIFRYSNSLRRVYLEVWHPRSRIDIMLAKCLTELPTLEQFVYCGEIDKFDSLIEICEFLLNYTTKLKFLKILVLEDPCYPGKYRETVSTIEENYKKRLYDRGINFCLGTHIV